MSSELPEEQISQSGSSEGPRSLSERVLYIIVGIVVVLVLAVMLLMFVISP